MASSAKFSFYGNGVTSGFNFPPYASVTAVTVAGVPRTYTEPNLYRIVLDSTAPTKAQLVEITLSLVGIVPQPTHETA